MEEGASDGLEEGASDGFKEGASDGIKDGLLDGSLVFPFPLPEDDFDPLPPVDLPLDGDLFILDEDPLPAGDFVDLMDPPFDFNVILILVLAVEEMLPVAADES